MNYNIVLDRLPTEYKGYLIRSDFRIGIQISNCLSDVELDMSERITSALILLFGNGVPDDFGIAYAGLIWFLSCGKKDITAEDYESDSDDSSEPEVMSFEQDITMIYSAFRKCFNINLAREHMHWFEFNALLNDISDCAMTNVIDIRTMKLSDVDKKSRAKVLQLKAKYAIERTDENNKELNEKIDRFNALASK